jgi:predicted O-methyltransferase YrrM
LLIEGRQALRIGDADSATRRFKQALRLEANIPEAHLGLALALRPGPDYLAWLEALHDRIRPRFYLEIGVETGRSLRLAKEGTNAIGIDPSPSLPFHAPIPPTIRVIARTSRELFGDPDTLETFPDPIDFAFIDGDHRFPSVLQDFMDLERHMTRRGVIAVHDTWPLDPLTASKTRQTGFYTGDVWKLLPCLRAIRPDLSLCTICTAPTGLTLITGLDPTSTVLRGRFDQILAAYDTLPYGTSASHHLALRPNDWAVLDTLPPGRTTATAN